MYSKDCHDKKCLFHTGRTGSYKCCSGPHKKMFMLCERGKEGEIKKIRERLNS